MDKPLEQTYHRRKTLIKVLIAIGTITFIVLAFWGTRSLLNRPVDLSHLITGTAQYGPIENSITASGLVKPSSELTLISPLNTRIEQVLLINGTRVEPGETILLLETEFAELDYRQLNNELELKQNNVTRLKLELEKNIRDIELDDRIKDLQVQNFEALLSDAQRLLKIGGSTQEEVEKARQNLAIARLEKEKLVNELEYRKASIE